MKSAQIMDVLQLPVEDRLELVGAIWDSLSAFPDALRLSDEQSAELEQRLESFRRAPEQGSRWEDVKARILKGE